MDADPTMPGLLALAALAPEETSPRARQIARLSLFDWTVVTRAAVDEPLAAILRDYVSEEGGRPAATVAGGTVRVPARAAALANGAISHALDYDDTHFGHIGHLSVAVLPAALAVGEEVGAGAGEVCHAFLVGAEAACRVGRALGRAHYLRGFHQTATSGAYGATLAAGRLYGLGADALRHAISLVSTRASGLKSQFGTMGKPFNAGIAAANGVEAAALAGRGFRSCEDGFAGVQGFAETHADTLDPGAWDEPPPGRFLFEDNKYKLHACCHGAHAMIEALLAARRERAFAAEEVAEIDVRTNPRWLRVCDIKEPRTGLEVKFSYAYLAGMVLNDIPTAADTAYTDALGSDPRLAELARRVRVEGSEALSDTDTRATIVLASGERIETGHDLAAPLPAEALEEGLRGKARVLLGESDADRVWSAIADLDALAARDLAALIARWP